MSKLTSQEIISRIEQAPKVMQTMIAKAFIREDIDDESVQYLFNEMPMDQLCSDGATYENVDADAPEGIGAGSFTIRNYRPEVGNKNYITAGAGGWSTCIKGYPTDANCNVLSNCVGYASGRFNEIINIIRGTNKCTYTTLNCNAENFIERAVAAGLKTGSTPKVGAIAVWQQGTLASGDGVGHVGIVERVIDNNTIYTSESSYGGSAFFNVTRAKGTGNWGVYGCTLRGFIYLPDDVQAIVDGGNASSVVPTPSTTTTYVPSTVARDENKDQIQVCVTDLRIRNNAGTGYGILGVAQVGYYNFSETKDVDGYTWYKIGDNAWIASNSGWTNVFKKRVEAPTPTTSAGFKVGDTVKIIGTGNGSSNGNLGAAYGIGWTRQILRIYEGRPYPYQLGNNSGTTGFYAASAIQKI